MWYHAIMGTVNKMKRGKTLGELIGVRCQPELVDAIDGWRRSQPNLPNRPEAIRLLVIATLQILDKDPGEDSGKRKKRNPA
jgi:hypothetical protein